MTSAANREQFEAWNGESGERWVADADRRDRVLSPIADLLHHVAGISSGEQILDAGCGCGATTITAASAAGADGFATGVDLSAPMLEVARTRARAAGCGAVAFVQADAQTDPLDGRFDVAISRFGTMFFSDPTAAFTNIAQHLTDRGRLCIATWQPLEANEWLVLPGAALLPYGSLPDTGDGHGPGMFSQSDPTRIHETLDRAGFADIDSAPHTVSLRLGWTPDEAVGYLADTGPGRAILETIPAERHDGALTAVRDALLPHHHSHSGVLLGAAVWITTATRP